MKKIWISVLCMLLLISYAVPVGSASFIIYAPDGRMAAVAEEEVEAYTALGWYKSYAETIKTLYAPDGRQLVVYQAEVPAYLSVGWYAAREDIVRTLYALDGRTILVYLAEMPAYLEMGWYASYEEVVDTLYAPDGRTITVYKAETPAYLELGWSRMPQNGPMLALTFDDGPHGVYTDSIINTLSAYGAKATFFVLGCQVSLYPQVLQRAHAGGFEIGSHTYNHLNLGKVSATKVQEELSKTNDLVQRLTGEKPTLLRPPYGEYTDAVRAKAGMPLVLWNVDPRDWRAKNAGEIAEYILSHAGDGNIIILHDIYETTAEAVRIAVPKLVERGYRLVTVHEMAAAKGISLQNGMVYRQMR